MAEEKIIFTTGDNEEIEFFVVEQTRINNVDYVLVTDSQDDEADAYILKLTSSEDEDDVYEIVEEDVELEAISRVFAEILEDVDIEF